jgi:hypothetical protein
MKTKFKNYLLSAITLTQPIIVAACATVDDNQIFD